MMNLVTVLDRLIGKSSGDIADLTAARAEFEARRGAVRQEEPLWEAWTGAFLEWYVVERPTGPVNETRAELAALEASDPLERDALQALSRSQRLLAEVISLRRGCVELKDLLGGGRFAVAERRMLHGVSRRDVIEVRVVGWQDQIHFGRLFVHHPSGTGKAIAKRVAELQRKDWSAIDICDYFAERRVRCDRYRHVTPVRVYTTTSPSPSPSTSTSTSTSTD